MKTTKVFIGLLLVLAVANLFLSEWLNFGYVLSTLIISILLLIEEMENAKLTSKLADAENDARYWKERFDLGNMCSKKDAERIQELSAELETAKANSYKEVERKRCREKYNRLYKNKNKQVATEQKREPKKIEPFRMVVNPKQSAIVQQVLFDNGYEWRGGDKEVVNINAKAISFEEYIELYGSYPNKISAYFKDTHLTKLSFQKFMQLYGAKEQPYQIEGKTIKQLVEENLGIEVDGMFLCGYDKEFENSNINANWSPFLIGNDKITNSSFHKDKIILKNYSNIEWSNTTDVINAIKKHRNIK